MTSKNGQRFPLHRCSGELTNPGIYDFYYLVQYLIILNH